MDYCSRLNDVKGSLVSLCDFRENLPLIDQFDFAIVFLFAGPRKYEAGRVASSFDGCHFALPIPLRLLVLAANVEASSRSCSLLQAHLQTRKVSEEHFLLQYNKFSSEEELKLSDLTFKAFASLKKQKSVRQARNATFSIGCLETQSWHGKCGNYHQTQLHLEERLALRHAKCHKFYCHLEYSFIGKFLFIRPIKGVVTSFYIICINSSSHSFKDQICGSWLEMFLNNE